MDVFSTVEQNEIVFINQTGETLLLTSQKEVDKWKKQLIERCQDAFINSISFKDKCQKSILKNNCNCALCLMDKI